MLKTLKNKKAEGYIDVAVAVLVIALVLVLIISIWSMVTLKQDMTYMCTIEKLLHFELPHSFFLLLIVDWFTD